MSDINVFGFPVLCSVIQQSNGSIHPKINQKLQKNTMFQLQNSALKSAIANQNTLNIPTGNVIICSVEK